MKINSEQMALYFLLGIMGLAALLGVIALVSYHLGY